MYYKNTMLLYFSRLKSGKRILLFERSSVVSRDNASKLGLNLTNPSSDILL